jgi:hypothetical protein
MSIVVDGVANGTRLAGSASLGACLIVAAFAALVAPGSPSKWVTALWRALDRRPKPHRGPSLAL